MKLDFDFNSASILGAKIGIVILLIIIMVLFCRWCIRKATRASSPKINAGEHGVVQETLKSNPASLRAPPPSLQLFGRSRSETIAINVFAHLIHARGYRWEDIMVGYRPNILKNHKTGRCLEIDAYHPKMNVGIEYNGPQHYNFPNHIHPNTEDGRKAFDDGIERDNIKRKLCQDHGVKLVEIPYWIDTCERKGEEWVFKKTNDQEKWNLIRRFLETRI